MPHTYTTTELLSRLVSFDTTSRNSNLELAQFVGDYLDGYGVPYRLIHDETARKANLHAIVGPQQAAGLAFSGHIDSGPGDRQSSTFDPSRPRAHDSRRYELSGTD